MNQQKMAHPCIKRLTPRFQFGMAFLAGDNIERPHRQIGLFGANVVAIVEQGWAVRRIKAPQK